MTCCSRARSPPTRSAIAIVLMLLTFLQGGLMPSSTVGYLAIVVSLGILPVVTAFQLRNIFLRNAALAALDGRRLQSATIAETPGFAETVTNT